MKRKLVDYLVNSELVDRGDIQRCVLRASMNEEASVVDELTEQLDVDQQNLARVMADFWGLESWEDGAFEVQPPALDFISEHTARKFGVLPIANDDGAFKMAVYDVEKARPVIEKIRDDTGAAPSLVVTPRQKVRSEIDRHYGSTGNDEGDGLSEATTAPGRGIVRKNRKRRARPDRTTTRPNNMASPGARPPERPSAQAEPTRQVEFEEDNPFMDLVEQSKRADSSKSADETAAGGVDEEEFPDFFGDGDEADNTDEDSPQPAGRDEQEGGDHEVDQLAGALAEFDAELGDEVSEDEPALLQQASSVHWDEWRDDEQPAFPGLEGAGVPEDSGQQQPKPESQQSVQPQDNGSGGVFPEEGDSDELFDLSEDDGEEELTLAEVIERQRHIIRRLEREIDYQKGILQTMAELLVEARVISKSTLRGRLKAFKEQQRRRHEEGDDFES